MSRRLNVLLNCIEAKLPVTRPHFRLSFHDLLPVISLQRGLETSMESASQYSGAGEALQPVLTVEGQ